jgi:hypothetical protein
MPDPIQSQRQPGLDRGFEYHVHPVRPGLNYWTTRELGAEVKTSSAHVAERLGLRTRELEAFEAVQDAAVRAERELLARAG